MTGRKRCCQLQPLFQETLATNMFNEQKRGYLPRKPEIQHKCDKNSLNREMTVYSGVVVWLCGHPNWQRRAIFRQRIYREKLLQGDFRDEQVMKSRRRVGGALLRLSCRYGANKRNTGGEPPPAAIRIAIGAGARNECRDLLAPNCGPPDARVSQRARFLSMVYSFCDTSQVRETPDSLSKCV